MYLQRKPGLIGRHLYVKPVPGDLGTAAGEEGFEGCAGVGVGPMGIVEIRAGVGGVVAALNEPGGVDGGGLSEVGGVLGLGVEECSGEHRAEERNEKRALGKWRGSHRLRVSQKTARLKRRCQ